MKGHGQPVLLLLALAAAGCSFLSPANPTSTPLPRATAAPSSTASPAAVTTAAATITPEPTADLSWILEAPAAQVEYRLPLTIRHVGTRSAVLQYELVEEMPSELVVWRAQDRAGLRRLSQATSGPTLLEGLEPATLYEAVVMVGDPPKRVGGPWELVNFRTREAGGRTLRVAAFGDSGFGQEVTAELAQRVVGEGVDLVLHTGDVVYRVQEDVDAPSAFLRKLYRPLAPLLARVPFYPVPGNHEFDAPTYWRDQPYYQHAFPPFEHPDLSMPEEGEGMWYAFRIGDVQFIMLNSQSVFGYPGLAQQQAWLTERIEDPSARYSVVVSHVPPYTVGRHPEDANVLRDQWGHLFGSPRVPLVLAGHDHNYQRFVVADTSFVISGGGSSVLYPLVGLHPALQYGERVTHFVLLELGPDEIQLQAIDVGGRVMDEATIPLPSTPADS